MSSQSNLIRLLASGAWFSGEALGAELGISRAAVWKSLQGLSALSIEVESHRGKGYRLKEPLDLLDRQQISSALVSQFDGNETVLPELAVEATLDSTNKYLMERSGGDLARLVFAEHQSAGKGRRGREWQSPFARNLYFSIAWNFSGGVAAIEGLSLAVGAVLCSKLRDFGIDGASVKWPNDILVDGKKLGGVLIELAGDFEGDCLVVVGVGMNVDMPSSQAEKIDQPWIDLQSCGYQAGRNKLAASLSAGLIELLSSYEKFGFSHYKALWESLNAHANARVRLVSPSKEIVGELVGVTDGGALILDVNGNQETFLGGEISMRPVQ